MSHEEKIEIKIHLPKDAYNKIRDFVTLWNKHNELLKIKEEQGTIEDFIIGSVLRHIERIENLLSYDLNKNEKQFNSELKLQNRLKEIIKQLGIKQIDLCEVTNIDKSTMSFIMQNRNQPSIDHFLRIWAALNFPPIEDIFYRVPE